MDPYVAKVPILREIALVLQRIPLGARQRFSVYNLLELYIKGIINGAVSYRASAISYSFFVAIFPFLLVILNLIPYIPITNFQQDFWNFIDELLPSGTHDFIQFIFNDIAGKKRTGLLSGVFVLSLFLMTNGINAIFGGFESSYHTRVTRSVLHLYFVAMLTAFIFIALLLFSVALLLFVEVYLKPYVEHFLFFGEHYNAAFFALARKIYFGLLLFIGVSVLFYFGSAEKGNSFFSAGSFLTIVLVILTTYLFGIYIENFSNYNQLYGSIGALLIFLLYIWLNSVIILLGFDLNTSLLRLKETNTKVKV